MRKIIPFLLSAIIAMPAIALEPFFLDEMEDTTSDQPSATIIDEPTFVDQFSDDQLPDIMYLDDGQDFANVRMFDIAGIFLGMQFEDVQTLFYKTRGLYAPVDKNSIKYSIPKEWRYNLDYECRQGGIYIPAEVERCIQSSAKKRGFLYPAEMHLVRKKTGENIYVYFTSNLTNNNVWKIVYQNDVDEVEGLDEKFEYQREKKILTFWQSVLDKYGAPNSGTAAWISSDNPFDPMMEAAYGELILQDRSMHANDINENTLDSRARFQSKPYAF